MAVTINGTTGITNTGDYDAEDNDKILLGTGDDLEIYHSGSNSHIKDSGTGHLQIDGSRVQLRNVANDDPMVDCTGGGTVEIFHNGSKKFETSSSGCIVSGDSLKLPDGSAGTPSLTWTNEGNLDTGIFRPAANEIGFSTAGTHRGKFHSDGSFAVGVNAINGDISSSHFGCYMGYNGWFGNARDVNGNSGICQQYGNAGEHRVLGDGDVQNTNNSYGQISDQTLKQDIVDAASQWNDIKQVKVRKFRFKDKPTAPLQIGVVAQELETISPGLVKEVYENGNDGNKVKAVKYSVLYMKAIKALQEAMAKIETLETKVAALEAS